MSGEAIGHHKAIHSHASFRYGVRSGTSPNSPIWRGSRALIFVNQARAVRCFNTFISVEGVPTSGSLTNQWMCSGMTTYSTTTKR